MKPESTPLTILYEDPSIIVVDKPAGMVVHPAAGNPSGTLVNALLYHCQDLSGINGVLRPGIVHRLDKDTSGVMVVAKDDQAYHHLIKQFKNRTVEKVSVAIAHGNFNQPEGLIDLAIEDIQERGSECPRGQERAGSPSPAGKGWRVWTVSPFLKSIHRQAGPIKSGSISRRWDIRS